MASQPRKALHAGIGFTLDEVNKERADREDNIRGPEYNFANFPGLRTIADFSQGVLLRKDKVKQDFLNWQSTPIHKSLTNVSPESSKIAIKVHMDLLGYMGDKPIADTAALALDIIQVGVQWQTLRDEIYLLIIKQTSNNLSAESTIKGWQMIAMCSTVFGPSNSFEKYLMNHLLVFASRGRGAASDYARFSLRNIDAIANNVIPDLVGEAPTIDEIQAYAKRPPVLATVSIIDGGIIVNELPVPPDVTVGTLVEMCIGFVGFKDPRATSFGLFVRDMGEEDGAAPPEQLKGLKLADQPLSADDFLGDVFLEMRKKKRIFKLVFKRKIFLSQHSFRGPDLLFERLCYLQAEEEALREGHVVVEEEEKVVAMAGIAMVLGLGFDAVTEAAVLEKVPDFLLPEWKHKKFASYWAPLVMDLKTALVGFEPEDLQNTFLEAVQQNPLYGHIWFYVYKFEEGGVIPAAVSALLPRELLLGFNQEGVTLFTWGHKPLYKIGYADMQSWKGSSTQVSLTVVDTAHSPEPFTLALLTSQGRAIMSVIVDYNRACIAEAELTAGR